jgi:hypothetical protein
MLQAVGGLCGVCGVVCMCVVLRCIPDHNVHAVQACCGAGERDMPFALYESVFLPRAICRDAGAAVWQPQGVWA